jgi:hypothetical protein
LWSWARFRCGPLGYRREEWKLPDYHPHLGPWAFEGPGIVVVHCFPGLIDYSSLTGNYRRRVCYFLPPVAMTWGGRE